MCVPIQVPISPLSVQKKRRNTLKKEKEKEKEKKGVNVS